MALIENSGRILGWLYRDPIRGKSPSDNYFQRFAQGVTLSKHLIEQAQRISRETESRPEFPFARTNFEKNLPFVKDSVFLYMSYAPYFALSIYLLKDRRNFQKALHGLHALSEVSDRFYQKYPAHFPYGRQANTGLTYWRPDDLLYRFCYNFDSGNNTFPSQHVNLSAYCGLALLSGGYRRSAKLMLIWSVLIAASTLTAKQHFEIDVPAAMVLATKVNRRFSSLETMPSPAEFEAMKNEIFTETDGLLQNLIKGNYSPPPSERKGLIGHIDPEIIDIMRNIRILNPFDPIYSKVIENVMGMIWRS